MKKRLLFTIILIIFLITEIYAHKVNVFAYAEGNKVYTESYFSDGKKCIKAKIKVYDSNNNLVAEGITNCEGIFCFAPRIKDDLKIILEASMGHRAEYVLKKNELMNIHTEKSKDAEITEKEFVSEKCSDNNKTAKISMKDEEEKIMISKDELEEIIQTALKKEITPLKREIKKLQIFQSSRFTKIISGIGYIFGIFGIIFFYLGKKNDTGK